MKMKVKIPIKEWFDPDDPSNTSSPTSMQTSLSNMKMIDQLGGWSNQSVGQGYGDGYALSALTNYMTPIF